MDIENVTIGGSEISIVMGVNRWKTPLRLWAEKTGQFETEKKEGEWLELGTELEDFVAQKFSRKTGLKVRRDTKVFVHKDFPFAIGHIDRRITGTDELLECKTCSAWKAHEWEGEEIPTEYILQVMWYLGVLGMSKGHIAVLIGGQKFVYKEVMFDKGLWDKMIEAAKIFVEVNVGQNVPPIAIAGDSPTLMHLYPQPNKEYIPKVEDKETEILIDEIQALKRVIDTADKDRDDKEAKLKQIIGMSEGVETNLYRALWKLQKASRIDYDKLKADCIYEKYCRQSETRVLRINKKKEKSNG